MSNYRTREEVESHFGNIPATTLGERPVNPKTGNNYKEGTWTWWKWWYGLSDCDRNVYNDLTAELL